MCVRMCLCVLSIRAHAKHMCAWVCADVCAYTQSCLLQRELIAVMCVSVSVCVCVCVFVTYWYRNRSQSCRMCCPVHTSIHIHTHLRHTASHTPPQAPCVTHCMCLARRSMHRICVICS